MTLNRIDGLVQCFNGNSSIWNNFKRHIPKGVLVFDIETKDLKLGDGFNKYVDLPVWLNLDKAHDRYINIAGLEDFVIPDATDVNKIVFINSDKKYAYGDITITELIDKFTGVDGINDINSAQDIMITNLGNKLICILDILTNADNGKFVTTLNNKFAPSIIDIDDYINATANEAASSVSLTIDDLKFYKDTELTEEASFLKRGETYYVKIFANDRLENSITYDLSSASNCFDSITQNANINELWTIVINPILSSGITIVDLNIKCNTQYTLKNRIFNIDVVNPELTLGFVDLVFYKDEKCTDKITNMIMEGLNTYYAKIYCSDSYNLSRSYDLTVIDDPDNTQDDLAANVVTIENTQNERIFKITLGDITSVSKYIFIAIATNSYVIRNIDIEMTVIDAFGNFTITDIEIYKSFNNGILSDQVIENPIKLIEDETYYAKIADSYNRNDLIISYDSIVASNTSLISGSITKPDETNYPNVFQFTIASFSADSGYYDDCTFTAQCTIINLNQDTETKTYNKLTYAIDKEAALDITDIKFYSDTELTNEVTSSLISSSIYYAKILCQDDGNDSLERDYNLTVADDPNNTQDNLAENIVSIEKIVTSENIYKVMFGDITSISKYIFTATVTSEGIIKNINIERTVIDAFGNFTITDIEIYKSFNNGILSNQVIENIPKLLENELYYAKIIISCEIDDLIISYDSIVASNTSLISGSITKSDETNYPNVFQFTIASFSADSGYYDDCTFTAQCTITGLNQDTKTKAYNKDTYAIDKEAALDITDIKFYDNVDCIDNGADKHEVNSFIENSVYYAKILGVNHYDPLDLDYDNNGNGSLVFTFQNGYGSYITEYDHDDTDGSTYKHGIWKITFGEFSQKDIITVKEFNNLYAPNLDNNTNITINTNINVQNCLVEFFDSFGYFYSVALDNSDPNNPYYIAAGYENNALIVKFDSNLNVIAAKTYGGIDYDYFYSVTVDNTDPNNLYYIAVGYTNSEGEGSNDALIVKFDKNLNKVAAKTYGGSDEDGLSSIAVDNTDPNNIYYIAVGTTLSEAQSGFQGLIIKFDQNLNIVLKKIISHKHYSIAIDDTDKDNGNIYYIVVGESHSDHFLIIKFDQNLMVINNSYLDGIGTEFRSVIVDNIDPNNIYYIAVGETVIAKFDSDLNKIIAKTYSQYSFTTFYSIAIDNINLSDFYYVVVGVVSMTYPLIIKFDQNLNIIAAKKFNISGASEFSSVIVDNNGNYITGDIYSNNGIFKISPLLPSGSFVATNDTSTVYSDSSLIINDYTASDNNDNLTLADSNLTLANSNLILADLSYIGEKDTILN